MTNTDRTKNAFLIWADGDEHMIPIIDMLHSEGYNVSYWVGLPGPAISKAPEAVFHDHNSAWVGTPANDFKNENFLPAGKELIEKMYKTESLVLTMMHKRFDDWTIDKRRHLYYKMLSYWNGVFEKFTPDLILFPTVPHTVYNYIIYALAKERGIKTLMFEDTWVGDRMLMYKDWMEGSGILKEAIEKNQNVKRDDLSEDLLKYFEEQTQTKRLDATPIYMTHWKKQNSSWNLFKKKFKIALQALKEGKFLKSGFRYIKNIGSENLRKEYEKLIKKPDMDADYVYVPLSFQPERTTSPQGDMYVDQILMIETLSSTLPEGWKIYVKEHPSQWWLRSGVKYNAARYPGYYKSLSEIPNVSLVPIHTNSFLLTEKSRAVSVVTGTAGFEALLRNKPTLIFGYPWFRDYPDAFRIFGPKDAENAFQKIESGFSPSEQTMLSFLKSLEDVSIRGYIEGFVDKISKLSKEQSQKNIINALRKELNS